ncbi:MAG: FG-GAP-like repeat-containing protein [Bacteroidota bacterium]|nr:FG-GAP-like repeat-containing protein [Bacteroidota bacterium]
MRPLFRFLCLPVLLMLAANAQTVTIRVDNGRFGGHHVGSGGTPLNLWEETAILRPAGPCTVTTILIYYDGTAAGKDTIYLVGDPSEGALPPTEFVWAYNLRMPPIVFDYPGTRGWYQFDVSSAGLRCDGYDRIVIQHRLKPTGPFFGIDDDGVSSPLSSFLFDPFTNNSLGFPGVYYRAVGDFMIRAEVLYDFPSGATSAPPPPPTLVDVTARVGITDENGNLLRGARVSVVDWDGDGFDDIAVGSRFFRNRGDGTFETVPLGIQASSSVWGDYDNDGDMDCYAVNGGDNDKLYRNDGGGVFTDVTAQSGLSNPRPTVTPMWLDVDNDGRLDLFIANGRRESGGTETYYPDQLWRNNGDGTFANITASSGIAAGEPAPYYDCWAASACDFNNDDRVDIFVATYRLAPDLLYRNNGNGTFTEVGAATGVRGVPTASPQYFGHGAGTEWGDLDNDGDEDLVVGNLGHPDWRGQVSNPSLIFRNEGGSRFTEVHQHMGLKFFEMNFGVLLMDVDLDGYLDIWHCQYSYYPVGQNNESYRMSRMYINGGPPDFRLNDRTWHLGPRIHGAWTAARFDLENDGDMDFIVASPTDSIRVFRNEIPRRGRFLEIRLSGSPADHVNMNAYGSRVTVYAGGAQFTRWIHSGGTGTTATQNSDLYHFGLGPVDAIDSVVVRYPNGFQRTFTTLLPDRIYRIAYDGTIMTGIERSAAPTADESGWRIEGMRHAGRSLAFSLCGKGSIRDVRVEVYDVLGNRLASVLMPSLMPGGHEIPLPAALPSGVYFVNVGSREAVLSSRFIVAR